MSTLVENIECVTLTNGREYTPDNLRGYISSMRDTYFDLELVSTPIVNESERVLNPERLTETDKYQLDHSPYILDRGPSGDRRFKTEFDWAAHMLKAAQHNAERVAVLRRKVTATYNEVHSRYLNLYHKSIDQHGKEMGRNNDEKLAWFEKKYPALCEIDMLFDNFLEEITQELERWKEYTASTSRIITAQELSYKAQGKLYEHRSV